VLSDAERTRHLQPRTMDVLVCLASRAGDVVPRDELISCVWGPRAVSDEPLTRCIHEIRRQLDDEAGSPLYIQTIPKRGYRVIAPVTPLAPETVAVTEPGPRRAQSPVSQVLRQRVLWVASAYALIAWGVTRIVQYALRDAPAEIVFPDWTYPGLVLLLMLGFPVVVSRAWTRQVRGTRPSRDATAGRTLDLVWSRRGIDMIVVTALFAVLGGLLLDMEQERRSIDAAATMPTLAVMPFRGNGADHDWLGNGMAEDLLDALSEVRNLDVAARSSSFRAALQDMEPQQIGKELSVQYVLTGRVHRSRESLLVNVRLVDSVTGFNVWNQAYKRKPGALLVIDEEIATAVATALELVPPEQYQAKDAGRLNTSLEAYDNYLRARDMLQASNNPESLATATAYFQRAISRDTEMPGARTGLCVAYVRQIEISASPQNYGAANSACAEAILQSPASPEAHQALGDFYRVTGHQREAIEEYRWVTTERPDDVSAWIGLGKAYAAMDESEEAEGALRRAITIQPDDANAHESLAVFLIDRGRYDEAIEACRIVVALDRERLSGYDRLATALFMTGQFAEANQAYRQIMSRQPERLPLVANIARNYYFLGEFEDAATMYRLATRVLARDHRAWGGLGDSSAQISGGGAEARKAWNQARDLAADELRTDPDNYGAAIALAHYCAALREFECAQRFRSFAMERAPDDAVVNYLGALVSMRLGQEQAALEAAKRAMRLGYPRELFAADPLFRSTRLVAPLAANTPNFKGLDSLL